MDIKVDVSDLLGMERSYSRITPLVVSEMKSAMTRATLTVERSAKKVVPVDTGHLRRSITHEVKAAPGGVVGKVGSNVPYAKAVEFGTGLLSEAPDGKGGRHYPPPAALDGWAIRHGFHTGSRSDAAGDVAASPGSLGWMISQMIGRRGGLRPRPYLRPAIKENLTAINKEFAQVPKRVLAKLVSS